MLAINVSIPNRTVADVVQFRLRKLHLMQCNTVYIYSSLSSLKHGLSLSFFLITIIDRLLPSWLLITDSAPSVSLSACFHFIFWRNWPLTLIFCMCMDHDTSSPAIESQGNILIRIREKNACSTSIYGGVLRVCLLIDGRNSKFLLWRHQLAQARRGVRRGATKTNDNGGFKRVWA